jgi:plasmid stabilization system protein ParE
MIYKLKVTPAAGDDIDDIYSYIAETLSAPMAAQNLINKIENSFLSLRDAPYRCELSRNEILGNKGYHRLVINTYVALYLIDDAEKQVSVARVFHGGMDYEKFV